MRTLPLDVLARWRTRGLGHATRADRRDRHRVEFAARSVLGVLGLVFGAVVDTLAELVGRLTKGAGEFGQLRAAEQQRHDGQDDEEIRSKDLCGYWGHRDPPWVDERFFVSGFGLRQGEQCVDRFAADAADLTLRPTVRAASIPSLGPGDMKASNTPRS